MTHRSGVLGIDIGSVSLSMVEMDADGHIRHTRYRFHHGDIRRTLHTLLRRLDLSAIQGIACTTAAAEFINGTRVYDSRIANIKACKTLFPEVRAILSVGGEKFNLITFSADGSYQNMKANTSCAAGTGSYLDQQATRLKLSGSAALSETALRNRGSAPVIASRCSVFARSDIVHAQQTGYTIEEISDGICKGLADNITDILFCDPRIPEPLVFSGGVSRNKAVVRHLEKRINKTLHIHRYSHLFDAIGAALLLIEEMNHQRKDRAPVAAARSTLRAGDILLQADEKRDFFYDPLDLTLSAYPQMDDADGVMGISSHTGANNPVETEIYQPLAAGSTHSVYLGCDVGSTSTKAVLMDPSRRVVAGFYTRTAGQPLKAIQGIFDCMDQLAARQDIRWRVIGAGTTGAGRRFAGNIIGADLILDEITAHARAAYELNPETDTIFEIGGQDAKFTTMNQGMVTFSQMNTVCAAGTGTFIEEQALKLGVPLNEVSRRAEGVQAPLVSDRCTVFMERDINRFLHQKYTVDEILAASLFAVRENYLLKVAVEGSIGSHVCFQGATARIKALVAAFEQRIQKPITVSKYCHLTGALGVALLVAEERSDSAGTTFRGIDIHRDEIPIRTEYCQLCSNNCRLRIASIKGKEVAYGFLCGRDYETPRYVDKNDSGFDLIKAYQRAFHPDPSPPPQKGKHRFTMGIPAGLHLLDELPFWKCFFGELAIPLVTSENAANILKLGKSITGAEFCAPMNAFHGHARVLAGQADCLFLPIYLEEWNTTEGSAKKYCYYTQFSSSLVATLETHHSGIRCISPTIGYQRNHFFTKLELLKSLNEVVEQKLSFLDVSHAFDTALSFHQQGKKRLQEECTRHREAAGDIQVVLLGRPYSILSPWMNKGIPGLIGAQGVPAFFQDMLPVDAHHTGIPGLVNACGWKYAGKILLAAEYIAAARGLYPVLVTSFKCSPDSMIIEYFKRIMDARGKPYLILQLDEHDSNVGYETRIEAGIRSFRNHAAGGKKRARGFSLPIVPVLAAKIDGKTLLFPNWDSITGRFLVANLQREGLDARLLEEEEQVVRQSMRSNTGQCIPLSAITFEFIEYIKRHRLDPQNTVLWMIKSSLACNISMYPHYIKSLLETHGSGMEKAGVYAGDISHIEISPKVTLHTYFAYLFGGLLRKLGCYIRPYELRRGETDRVIERAAGILEEAFLGRESYLKAVESATALFESIQYNRTPRPKVAIFGDLYMRDNAAMNQGLIRFLEDAGGEVITTPYNEYVKIISSAIFRKYLKEKRFLDFIKNKSLLAAMEFLEKKYFPYFEKFLGKTRDPKESDYSGIFAHFNMKLEQGGESWENILKVFHILKEHPDISLFVQTNPAFCCPALVTEAMARHIEHITGVPVVTLTYDGTGVPVNDQVIPYLEFPRKMS